jgi:NADPH-dependent 2,4-dienoyl-CoA reductase/sulfur reductase-like enzyme
MIGSYTIPDLVIVGAGPAGLGAAITARRNNLRVVVLDDQLEPGGQIWRGSASVPAARARKIGSDYVTGGERVREFLASGAEYYAQTTVWQIEYEGEQPVIYCAGPDGGKTFRPKTLLLATGALERSVPLPGWTLPGVMTGGALQVLLKTSGLSSDKVVLAGAGPLLWLVAAQMVAAETPPLAVVECIALKDYIASARYLPKAMRNLAPLIKGLGLIGKVRRAAVPVYHGARNLRIEGDTHTRAVVFDTLFGREKRIAAEVVGLHCGVIPNQQATRLLRLPHSWSNQQLAFLPDRDAELCVSNRVFLAGDGARIGGAEVAWLEGQLVGAHVAGADTSELRRSIKKLQSTRRFIDRLYKPAQHLRKPKDETVLCRCEAITAGRVRQAVRDGAMGPNQVKFVLRTGMGPCQGRVCGLALSEVIAEGLNQSLGETGYLRIRPPLKPMPLGTLIASSFEEASLEDPESQSAASQP